MFFKDPSGNAVEMKAFADPSKLFAKYAEGEMHECRVAIAGFGGVGRAVAGLLLFRRERYRQLYGTDVRLVAACGSKAGISDPTGLEWERLNAFVSGSSGPDFLRDSGADVLIEAGPSDFRTGGPGLA